MILSNVEIHAALDSGNLIIEPQPTPRLPSDDAHCPYNTHTVDLRLGSEISIPDSGPFVYDVTKRDSLAPFIYKNAVNKTISSETPHILKQNQFVLGITMESIGLPISKDGKTCLAARIEGKSSRARLGLLVHFTAPTVHPGFDGTLTLEMINLGASEIALVPGMPIAQLIIEEVRGIPNENPSQFQGQKRPEGAV